MERSEQLQWQAPQPLSGEVNVWSLENLISLVDSLDQPDEDTFHAFEFELVYRYRTVPADQERIATAVSRKSCQASTVEVRHRVDEILAMLEVTHNPLI
jgi:hypothetical protein